jgi:protein TonB
MPQPRPPQPHPLQPQREAAMPPPPRPKAPSPAAPSMNVNLGDGSADAFALLDGDIVHPAQADSGNTAPQYPIEAARRHEQGTVVIGLLVDESGSVVEARVVQSSGSQWLDRAARDQLAMWHFHPATQNGAPVGDAFNIKVHFDAGSRPPR